MKENRELSFTLYENKYSKEGEVEARTWVEWLPLFMNHDIRGGPESTDNKKQLDIDKDGPAVVFGACPGRRNRTNVKSIDALAIDIDDSSEEDVMAALAEIDDFEYVMYTTHKHGSELAGDKPRVRIILPLAESITSKEHRIAWDALTIRTKNVNDVSTRDSCRLNYLPSTFDVDLANAIHHEGKLLDAKRDMASEARVVDVSKPRTFKAPATSDLSREGKFAELANKVRHGLRKAEQAELRDILRKILKGESFAPSGQRNALSLKATMWMAHQDATLEEEDVLAWFAASFASMHMEDEYFQPPNVWAQYHNALEKIVENQELREALMSDKQDDMTLGQAVGGENGPYTDADLARIAAVQEIEVEDLEKRWVIQRDGAQWLLTADGDYAGPFLQQDLMSALPKYLGRAPVQLTRITQNGGITYRKPVEVCRDHGDLALKIRSDMASSISKYDPETLTMTEAVARQRTDLKPVFHQAIDEWLRIMGGPCYGKLIDWMSVCNDLNVLLCGIYFKGAPGSGKTLFAHGMSKLWTRGGPSELVNVLSGFNDEVMRCPLIMADEEMPPSFRTTNVTANIRSMLSTTSRSLNRKYMPTSDLTGAIRLIIAANNEFLLSIKDVATADDMQAIAQRFLYIQTSKVATEHIKAVDRETLQHWASHRIAEHALWLTDHHTIENPGHRFMVEGDMTQMSRILMTTSHANALVCEFLVRYLMNPKPVDGSHKGLIRRQEGDMFVNTQAVLDFWTAYLDEHDKMTTNRINAALRAISKEGKPRELRWKGKKMRYRHIDIENLLAWSDSFGIGEREDLLRTINKDTRVIKAA